MSVEYEIIYIAYHHQGNDLEKDRRDDGVGDRRTRLVLEEHHLAEHNARERACCGLRPTLGEYGCTAQ